MNQPADIVFHSKGLHFCNLNIRHIVPKVDELRIMMSHVNCPDIFGMCETFLTNSISDDQIAIDDFEFIRKDRSDTQDKTGGGVILYYRQSINCKRKRELEVSNIETLWAEITLPNSKPFLVCTLYRPPDSKSEWIDLFEEELSIAQTTGLELIIMGDFNIDLKINHNRKWQNIIDLFDLTQHVKVPTRVTASSSTIIDHIYTSHPKNITESFVSTCALSDHFPVCFTRKINSKISKLNHITTSYRCFKNFNEEAFISDLASDLNDFSACHSDINDDISNWYGILVKHLDRHAPFKTKRVKTKHLPEWYNDEIAFARKQSDNYKRRKSWSEFKKYRNKVKKLIRSAKRKCFTDSVTNSKDTRTIWQHFRKVNNKEACSKASLPDEIVINDERYTSSFRKAFDLVDHNILIKKLSAYKFCNLSLKWFKSYLEARQQTVQSDSGMSDFANIHSGVPQGSILGPTLFLLFINDLPLLLKYCYADLFADDAIFHKNSPDIGEINDEMLIDFFTIVFWSKQNKLPINFNKSTYMILGAKRRLEDTFELLLNIGNEKIEKVSKQKLLGIFIDEHLSWTPHIDYLCSIIASKISLLKQLSSYVPQNIQKLFYQSYILPLMDYGCNTWGTTSTSNIERISKLQKRAARIILRAEYLTPSDLMFEELGWQSVPKRLMYNKAILTFKALNNQTPAYITNLLKPMSESHPRSLRSSENGLLSVPRSSSALYDRSFSYSASKLWNCLPQSLRTSSSLSTFKTGIKDYISHIIT